MAKYITLMRKQDFSDLYKYGFFHANRDCIVEFQGDIENVRENYNFFNSLTFYSNPFDSSFTYLFVQYTKQDSESRKSDIMIEEVEALFPLDEQAKILLEEDFGPNIQFSEPLWSKGVNILKNRIIFDDCKKGSHNIFKILGISEDSQKYCEDLIPDNVFEEVLKEISNNERPQGDLSPWVYILRYERHAIYPRTSLGYCMDAVHALTNYSQKREFYSIEASDIYKYLDNQDYELYLDDYISDINKSDVTRRFADFAKNIIPGCNILLVASLYFIFRNKYRDGLRNDNYIEKCLKFWPKELPIAVYMLGWMLGHSGTFECLYDKMSLNFTCKRVNSILDNNTFDSDIIKDVQQGVVEQKEISECSDASPKEIKMGKLKKNPKHPKDVTKTPKPIIVRSEAEQKIKESEGWVVID